MVVMPGGINGPAPVVETRTPKGRATSFRQPIPAEAQHGHSVTCEGRQALTGYRLRKVSQTATQSHLSSPN